MRKVALFIAVAAGLALIGIDAWLLASEHWVLLNSSLARASAHCT
jgi:hypothetical protein